MVDGAFFKLFYWVHVGGKKEKRVQWQQVQQMRGLWQAEPTQGDREVPAGLRGHGVAIRSARVGSAGPEPRRPPG